jgi:hypothetical protein
MVGHMGRGPVRDVHQFAVLDLDRLDVMEFGRRGRFGHVHRAAAKRSAASCNSRQFCQCHPNRHVCCL